MDSVNSEGETRGRALVYRYVWRDDTSDTFEESVASVCWGGDASLCVSYALLSAARDNIDLNPF